MCDFTDERRDEDAMSDMQTKLIMASIADILTTSQDLGEAYERFKRLTNAAGILIEDASLRAGATLQDKLRLPALDADVVIDKDVVTIVADDGIVISLSMEEWEALRNEFGLDHIVDYERGETPASGYIFRTCVNIFRKHKSLVVEKEHLSAEQGHLQADSGEK